MAADSSKSAAAEASSAHSRVNIPLNLKNWSHLPDNVAEQLLWFHQHILDEDLSWRDATEAIGYDRSVVFRVLKGTYQGKYDNVADAICSYAKIVAKRGTIQENVLVDNGVSRMIGAGLDYALANNSITLITGESRMGKTVAATMWRDRNNHGRSVLISAPAYGGNKLFLRRLASAVGVNKNLPLHQIVEAVIRAFNPNRMLIIDEAHRLLPGDRRSNPVGLEIARDIHDETQCGLAFIATQRFTDELHKSTYQYEQLLGRIGMPIRLKRRLASADYLPILKQYIPDPSKDLREQCARIANERGRLGILVETLKVASRMASKDKRRLTEKTIFDAIALRAQMMGETEYAAK
jgi:DNA transposition AAA+ family ATPase